MNETIYYKSPVGLLRIKNNEASISEVSFVSTTSNKVNEDEFECLKASSPVIKKCIKQLDEYFAGTRFDFELPLAQKGTSFQQSVWANLQKIKFGKTLTYLLLSKNLGNVKAIRAVGTANGKNNIAIIVPCHRVIGSTGSLVGYAGDLWRKKWLLSHEAKYGNGVQSLF